VEKENQRVENFLYLFFTKVRFLFPQSLLKRKTLYFNGYGGVSTKNPSTGAVSIN